MIFVKYQNPSPFPSLSPPHHLPSFTRPTSTLASSNPQTQI
ncbi:hypothetical protein F8388_000971 [Cannabis sativa]|uniref:Uncharacterized protein n=1 Tax=Cannabis sativa TaxID=3483 RepID=A0A7J6FQ15_CANSA|nr:hypothetical protein F8388_000971 [Cannabis sativa]